MKKQIKRIRGKKKKIIENSIEKFCKFNKKIVYKP